ncbi:glycosyltransferase [Cytobacillus praedii]|uniref:glycosyltransferase n=1 Tax=Cytobacillus praedii TaxID=1742358 RepID=UPI003F7FB4E7
MDEVDILLTSIIILTYNNLEYTKQCLESIRKYTDRDTYELIIIDNNSVDDTKEWLLKQDDIRVIINKENLGFPRGCNQGIEIAKGENILLLNNDVIVTENWLSNMVNSLYSEDRIGAVGPVTNSAAYYTAIPVEYSNLNEMHNFAQDFNKSDSEKWEERLKLIGYCMLIKRDVVDKIGLLDERFTPGNFEDDDYSVRIRQAGYKLLLCKDTFIHHYGSVSWKENISGYGELLSENEKKFMEKWGTNSHSYIIHNELIDKIPFEKDRRIDVLHIGCAAGGTLLKINDLYSESLLYGIEKNKNAAIEAGRFVTVFHDPVEKVIKEMDRKKFDVIIITDWSHITTLQTFMLSIKNLIKDDGILLSSVFNSNHISLINSLMLGRNPFLENKYMTLLDINKLFKGEAGFKLRVESKISNLSDEEMKVIELYCSLSKEDMSIQYETYKYLITAQKYDEHLENSILNIINEIEVEKSLIELEQYSEDEIIECITNRFENSIQILHTLAILNYSNNNHENVLSYLHKAYEIDPNNSDTLYNLGVILYSYNEKELAKRHLECLELEDKDDEVVKILAEINFEEEKRKQLMVYLFRRLEHEIELKGSKEELLDYISNNIFTEQEIMETILNTTINKEKVLNIVAITAFENGLNDCIFPFLNKAYELNPKDDDTLYNLGYILSELGENEVALKYLQKIHYLDEETEKMISNIQSRIQDCELND